MNLCVSESNCMTCRIAHPQIDDCSQMTAHTCTHTSTRPPIGWGHRPTTPHHSDTLKAFNPLGAANGEPCGLQ